MTTDCNTVDIIISSVRNISDTKAVLHLGLYQRIELAFTWPQIQGKFGLVYEYNGLAFTWAYI